MRSASAGMSTRAISMAMKKILTSAANIATATLLYVKEFEMVEVITRRTPPNDRVYEVTCTTCKSDLRFKRQEGELLRDQRDGDFLEIKCPVCEDRVTCGVDDYVRDGEPERERFWR
jgi:ribosomal protein S27E